MIVASFNEQDLMEEIKKDVPNVLDISDKKDDKVRRIILKSSLFPVYVHSLVTTPRKNKWLILWEAKDKRNIGDNSIITFVCLFETPMGRYAYMPTWKDGEMKLLAYPPHFFSRFAQRMLLPLTGIDLIRRYFERNASYGFSEETEMISETSAVKHLYGSSSEGVALGFRSPVAELALFKTFVSYSMLKGEQIATFAATETIRKEMHEKDLALPRP